MRGVRPGVLLLAQHYPGGGVIDFATITAAVEATGYDVDVEVEIFNKGIWDSAGAEVVARTVASFSAAVGVTPGSRPGCEPPPAARPATSPGG